MKAQVEITDAELEAVQCARRKLIVQWKESENSIVRQALNDTIVTLACFLSKAEPAIAAEQRKTRKRIKRAKSLVEFES